MPSLSPERRREIEERRETIRSALHEAIICRSAASLEERVDIVRAAMLVFTPTLSALAEAEGKLEKYRAGAKTLRVVVYYCEADFPPFVCEAYGPCTADVLDEIALEFDQIAEGGLTVAYDMPPGFDRGRGSYECLATYQRGEPGMGPGYWDLRVIGFEPESVAAIEEG